MKILLDAGHGIETPGKRSPDGLFREYKWTREMATLVKEKLLAEGLDVIYICEGIETDTPLRERCRLINQICSEYGIGNCISVSIHNNAAASDGKWHNATGWEVFVSLNASTKSKKLARYMYEEAKAANMLGNRRTPIEGYYTQNLAMCRDTRCPAVLVENMFQDNKSDVAFLNSSEGKEILANIIVNGIKKYISNL